MSLIHTINLTSSPFSLSGLVDFPHNLCFAPPGDFGSEGFWLQLVLPDSPLLPQQHRIQKEQLVQVLIYHSCLTLAWCQSNVIHSLVSIIQCKYVGSCMTEGCAFNVSSFPMTGKISNEWAIIQWNKECSQTPAWQTKTKLRLDSASLLPELKGIIG